MYNSYPSNNRRKRWYDFLTAPAGRLVRWVLALVLLGLVLVVSVMIVYGWRAASYDLQDVNRSLGAALALSDEGQRLGSPFNREGIIVKYEQLPPHLVQALLAREDESFERHNGIDFTALVRSLIRNTRDMSYTQGGSTISMQLARNAFELGRTKSLDRKLLEMALALRLERNFSKNEILEAYLNRVYFGAGAYGIGDAAQTFFQKDVSQLTVGESALLAGIIRAPSLFNPFTDPEKALVQRNETLDRMAESGFLQRVESDALKQESITFAPNDLNSQTSYPLKWIKQEMKECLEDSENPDKNLYEETGLFLSTSIHLPLQRHVERTAELTLQKLEKEKNWPLPKRETDASNCLQAAVLVIRPNTGSLMAIIGGRDPHKGSDIWNEHECIMGELFAPVIYAAASNASRFIVRGNPVETSRNLEPSAIINLARRAGITGELPEGIELADGNFRQKLIVCVPLLLAFHNGGYEPKLHTISNAVTPKGVKLYDHANTTPDEPVIPPDAARVVYKMPPFQENSEQKLVSVRSVLRNNSGFFCAKIHSRIAVFVWLGQVTPEPDAYENTAFKRLLNKTAEELAFDVLSFVIDVPRPVPLPVAEPPKKPDARPASRTPARQSRNSANKRRTR